MSAWRMGMRKGIPWISYIKVGIRGKELEVSNKVSARNRE